MERGRACDSDQKRDGMAADTPHHLILVGCAPLVPLFSLVGQIVIIDGARDSHAFLRAFAFLRLLPVGRSSM